MTTHIQNGGKEAEQTTGAEGTERLFIAYSANANYFPMVLLSAISVAEKCTCPVTFYLFTMDLHTIREDFLPITEAQRAIFEEVVREYGDHRAVLLDGTKPYLIKLRCGKNTKNQYTPYAQGRLLFDEFDLPEKLVYLDSDVMCCGDAAEILKIDFSEFEIAASLDVMGKFWISRDYCNTGIVLMNMEYMRRTQLLSRCCSLVRRKWFCFPDQTTLNRLAEKKQILPRRFNEQRNIRSDTLFKHFCKGVKWFPIIRMYNYKQTQVKKLHKRLKIFCFDEIFEKYRTLAVKYGLKPLEE